MILVVHPPKANVIDHQPLLGAPLALCLASCAATSAIPAGSAPIERTPAFIRNGSPPPPETAHGARGFHDHHLAVFLGLGVETRGAGSDENGFAFGADYTYRFHGNWGAGAVIEGLGQDAVRDYVVLIPLTYYATQEWRIFAGPGIESTPDKDKSVFRVGSSYDFSVSGGWTIGPQITVDFIETGQTVYLGGVAVGYGW